MSEKTVSAFHLPRGRERLAYECDVMDGYKWSLPSSLVLAGLSERESWSRLLVASLWLAIVQEDHRSRNDYSSILHPRISTTTPDFPPQPQPKSPYLLKAASSHPRSPPLKLPLPISGINGGGLACLPDGTRFSTVSPAPPEGFALLLSRVSGLYELSSATGSNSPFPFSMKSPLFRLNQFPPLFLGRRGGLFCRSWWPVVEAVVLAMLGEEGRFRMLLGL